MSFDVVDVQIDLTSFVAGVICGVLLIFMAALTGRQ